MFLAALVVFVGPPRQARAESPVDAVHRTMREADDSLQRGLPARARASVAQAERGVDAMSASDREKVADEFKGWRERVSGALAELTVAEVATLLDRLVSQAENA